MGVLVYLPERVAAERRLERPKAGPAQILFFTGVRYERHPDAPEDAHTSGDGPAADAPRPRRRRRG